MKPVIISAPFGNYRWFNFDGTTPTLGTFTLNPRGVWTSPWGGAWFRVLWTVRYSLALRGWKNRIGLKNPGIKDLVERVKNGYYIDDKIVSIHGFTTWEWKQLFAEVSKIKPLAVELNVSCPNVGEISVEKEVFQRTQEHELDWIVKIPPVNYEPIVEMAYSCGIRKFHACNTMPIPTGGMSGKPLKPVSLCVVKWLRTNFEDVTIIGGGGITCVDDVNEYMSAGANHAALATMLFNPFNWFKVKSLVKAVRTY